MTGSAKRIIERLQKSHLDAMNSILDDMGAEIERLYPSGHYQELLNPASDWSAEDE